MIEINKTPKPGHILSDGSKIIAAFQIGSYGREFLILTENTGIEQPYEVFKYDMENNCVSFHKSYNTLNSAVRQLRIFM